MRLLSIVLVFATAVWSHVGSTLVLCHSADGHSEIESISAPCCPGPGEAPDATLPLRTVASKSVGCADSCSDTLLLASVDRPTPPRTVMRIAALGLPAPLIASSAGHTMRMLDAGSNARGWSIKDPQQLTVLRI